MDRPAHHHRRSWFLVVVTTAGIVPDAQAMLDVAPQRGAEFKIYLPRRA